MAPGSLLGRQLARPTGWRGRLAAREMAVVNGRMISSAVALLAVEPGEEVLEIGFGGGQTLGHLARLAAPGTVAGVDYSPTMVAAARRRHRAAVARGDIEIHEASVESLPLDTDRFDRVLSVNCLPYWPDAVAGLREVARVLNPAGRGVISIRPPGVMRALRIDAPTLVDEGGFRRLCDGVLDVTAAETTDDKLGGSLHFTVSVASDPAG